MAEKPSFDMPDNDYAGDVDCKQAWDALANDPAAILVDVRTKVEWQLIGRPDLSSLNKEPVYLQWVTMEGINENFVDELQAELSERGIAADALDVRPGIVEGVAQLTEEAGFGHEGIAVGKEDLAWSRVALRIPVYFLVKLLHLPHPELLVAVHGAEGAAIPAASHRGLEDQAIALRGWTVDRTFVLDHGSSKGLKGRWRKA